MAIQGIITGFADPADHSRNLILIGRGDGYVIIKNGISTDPATRTKIGAMTNRFSDLARRYVGVDWLAVRGAATDNLGHTRVTALGAKVPDDLLAPRPSQTWFNKPQRLFLENYDEGEFAHISNACTETEFRTAVAECGDGLVKFFITELADSESCKDLATAVTRMRAAQRQIDDVVEALESAAADAQWDGAVFVCVTGKPSDDQDEEVPGVYIVNIRNGESVNLASPEHLNSVATATLNCFHEHYGIACLDDFEIVAMLEDGMVLTEADDHHDAAPMLALRASFVGRMDADDEEVPPPVAAAYRQAQDAAVAQRNNAEQGN